MKKKVISGFLAVMLLVMGAGPIGVQAEEDEWDVTRSETDYTVEFDNSGEVFLCNKSTAGSKVGTEYYLTYTVESMQIEKFAVSGVLGTNQPNARWPYVTSADGKGGGYMNHSPENLLMVEGNTYFVKFTITEDGYKYRVGWAKDDEAEYINLIANIGEVKTDSEYFGMWFGSHGMTGKLIRVRCYDKDGNDLGVRVTAGKNAKVSREETFSKDTKVDHKYTLELTDVFDIAISNKKEPTGGKVYIEYKVKSAEGKSYQCAGIVSGEPKAKYPYLNGYMEHYSLQPADATDCGPLLVEGAEYLLIFEQKKDRVDIIVQQTLNGKTSFVSLDKMYGEYDKNDKFFSLWLAGNREMRFSAVLEDFKIYDSNKNNLGVQTNWTSNVKITHFGELEDYAGCEALYACAENGNYFALYADKTLKFTEDGLTREGTFKVKDAVMTATMAGKTEEYEYRYQLIKDADGNVYKRVHTCKVIFETGKGTEIEPQILNEENGYQVLRPTDPTLEGNTFEGWYTHDGEAFDFEQIVTSSITLYAKWSDTEWIVPTIDEEQGGQSPYIFIVGGVLILAAASVCGGIIIKRGKKRAE